MNVYDILVYHRIHFCGYDNRKDGGSDLLQTECRSDCGQAENIPIQDFSIDWFYRSIPESRYGRLIGCTCNFYDIPRDDSKIELEFC